MKWLIGIVVALSMTFYAGYENGKQDAERAVLQSEVDAYKKSYEETVAGAVASYETNNRIEKEITVADANQTKIVRAVQKRIDKQLEKSKEDKHETGSVENDQKNIRSCPEFRFDVGTVRLFNLAREGATVSLDTLSGSDETLSAVTEIGIKSFVTNDMEIVRMYHDLAKRHDELVDEVEKHLKTQGTK